MNSTATCSTWREMVPVRLHRASDSPSDEDNKPYHTGLIAARVNKDHAFRRTPGRKCKACYWCIIEDSWKRQHHHWHMKHKNTKSSMETPGTNTRNGQVQMEHPWTLAKQQQKKDTRFSSVEKMTNTSMALDFLFTRTS